MATTMGPTTRAIPALLAALTLGRTTVALAEDGPAQTPPAPPPASEVHVEIGGSAVRGQDQAWHDVRITSDADGTRIVRTDMVFAFGEGISMPGTEVCVAPCTVKMTRSATYTIRGWGIAESAHFGINDETTALDVHTGSTIVGGIGTTAVVLGIVSVIAGVSVLPVGYLEPPTNTDRPTIQAVGWGTLLGGAALIGLGVGLGFVATTHIYDQHGARLARLHPPRLTLAGLTF